MRPQQVTMERKDAEREAVFELRNV